MLVWLATTAALATPPSFKADVAVDGEVASRAWAAAEACTGRTAPSAPEIAITRSVIPGGWLGRAHVHDQGLERLDVSAPAQRVNEVIVHEIAHAWVAKGDQALVEGAAELLADCIVAHDPGIAPLQFDDGRDLVALTDLRTWGIAEEGKPLAMDGARTDAYLGASRLLRTATLVMAESLLWQGEELTWASLEGWLEAEGASAAPILDVVRAGPVEQREALRDRDLDGVTDLAEGLVGTDPLAFDTDGDGWWDGARPPEGAVPVPLDGTFACAGEAHGSVRALPGGNLRGLHVPTVTSRTTEAGVVLVALDSENTHTSGGMWAEVTGVTPSDACLSDPRRTVAAATSDMAPHVQAFAEALDTPLARAAERLGPATTRVAVLLGGDTTSFDGRVARVASHDLARAQTQGTTDELAAAVVALPRVWGSSDRSWREAQALGRSLLR